MSLLDFYNTVRNGNQDALLTFLDENTFKVDESNKLGYTSLLIACTYNQKHIIDFLLSRGANLHHRDAEGWTVLHKAAFMKHEELYNYLVSLGADPTIRTNNGHLPTIGFWDSEPISEQAPEKIPEQEPQKEETIQKPQTFVLPQLLGTKESTILCPGQGAQALNMAQNYMSNDSVKQLFQEANKILGYDILSIINSDKTKLDSTDISQPAIYLTSLASYIHNYEKVKESNCVAGFSLGEYTSLVVAGYVDWVDGLKLVQKRGELMLRASKEQPTGMISIVGLDDDQINSLCKEFDLSIANYLFPKGRALAGTIENINKVESKAKSLGALSANKLAVSGAFHSKYMNSAKDELKKVIDQIELKESNIRVYSNFTGTVNNNTTLGNTTLGNIKHNLVEQLTNPVQWEKIISSSKTDCFELAPAKQLKAMIRRIDLDRSNKTEIL